MVTPPGGPQQAGPGTSSDAFLTAAQRWPKLQFEADTVGKTSVGKTCQANMAVGSTRILHGEAASLISLHPYTQGVPWADDRHEAM